MGGLQGTDHADGYGVLNRYGFELRKRFAELVSCGAPGRLFVPCAPGSLAGLAPCHLDQFGAGVFAGF